LSTVSEIAIGLRHRDVPVRVGAADALGHRLKGDCRRALSDQQIARGLKFPLAACLVEQRPVDVLYRRWFEI
jgi:hypothetical protein